MLFCLASLLMTHVEHFGMIALLPTVVSSLVFGVCAEVSAFRDLMIRF